MKTESELEASLRATFAAQAAAITEGPIWDHDATGDVFPGAQPVRRADHDAQPPGGLTKAGPPKAGPPKAGLRKAGLTKAGPPTTDRDGPGRRPHRPSRWRAPVLAAAAVAAVVGTVVTIGAVTKTPTMTPAASSGGSNSSEIGSGATSIATAAGPITVVAADGTITVAKGAPATSIDVYIDALCPICGEFEQANGPQIARQVDSGALAVRYRLVDFLNQASASGSYSTRAFAALISVARYDGAEPGVFTRFLGELFTVGTQPKEQAATDLSDADLAHLAAQAGASAKAQRAISTGAAFDAAQTAAAANFADLTTVAARQGRAPGVPTVAVGDTTVDTNAADWLADLLLPGTPKPSN